MAFETVIIDVFFDVDLIYGTNNNAHVVLISDTIMSRE